MANDVIFRAPSDCSASALAEFEAVVREGVEVDPAGLGERIKQAALLGLAYEGAELVGTGALKRPLASHRAAVTAKSGIALPAERYPFEIGWLFVQEHARGQGWGRKLLDGLLGAGKGGLFGTSRVDAEHRQVHASLLRRGFVRAGQAYASRDGSSEILHLVREPKI